MSNVPEETSKVTVSAINALKGNPLCLALLVLVAIIMVVGYFQNRAAQDNRSRIVQELIERCVEPRGL